MTATSSSSRYDAVVIGAGHNGLAAAAYLARAGLRVLVLERRDRVGGAVAAGDLGGAGVPVAAHTVGRLRSSIVRDLGLAAHGLELLQPEVRVFAPQPEGRALTLWGDPRRTAEEIAAWSAKDAAAYPAFDRKVRVFASFLAHVHAAPPPELGAGGLLTGLRLLRAFRRLPPAAARELVRVLPMPVADVVSDAFETDALRAALAARGVLYTAMGPRSAGTAAVLLADSVGQDRGAAGSCAYARGGPGALADALASAARSFGAEVRIGCEVEAVLVKGGRAVGVAVTGGAEVPARAVVSGADPRRTIGLVDPAALGPWLSWRARGVRMPGAVAKVNLVLDALPAFPGAGGDESRLRGRIVVAPGIDALERSADAAKYGSISEEPLLEVTIPTLTDPTLARGGVHVASVILQHAPYELSEGRWEDRRDEVADAALRTLEAHAPGIVERVVAREVLTPADLEREFGLTGGHPLHGEPGLDQVFAWRPMLGHARHRFGIEALYLCGSGAHPGGGVTGAPGANAAREILVDLRRGGA